MFGFFNGYILLPLLERAAHRDVFSKLKALNTFEKLSNEEQLQFQRDEAYRFLSFCQERIPYYRDVISRSGLNLEKIKTDIRHIQDLPVLTKDLIREHSGQMRQSSAHHVRKTGGSTGPSVFFYYDNVGMDWTSAINFKSYEMAGKRRYHRDCHISAELNLNPTTLKGRIQDWIGLSAHNRRRLMIDSFSDSHLGTVLKNLRQIRPYLLQGHPSSAYAIANYIERHGLTIRPLCRVFEPSGEALNEKMVAKIEQFMACKVVNRYGNAEFGVVAHSRAQDNYKKLKVFRRAFYVEPAEVGPLIVTNFTNLGFPLLRYDTGDVGTVKEEASGCYIYDIQGRIHDLVEIHGELFPTHYIMDFLDHRVKGVKEFQVVLGRGKVPKLNMVPEQLEDQGRILQMVQARWPQGLEVEFISYEQLKTVGWRQKFRHVIDERHLDGPSPSIGTSHENRI